MGALLRTPVERGRPQKETLVHLTAMKALKRARAAIVRRKLQALLIGVFAAGIVSGLTIALVAMSRDGGEATTVVVDTGGGGADDTRGDRDASRAIPAPTTAPTVEAPAVAADPASGQPQGAAASSGGPAVAAAATPGAAAPAGAPPAQAEPAGMDAGCVANCGEPRYFCDTWGGGFCDDYRGKRSGALHAGFPAPGDAYSFSAYSSTNPGYDMTGDAPSDGLYAFSANEHFMTVIEDPQFGIGVLRLVQPFDFAGREGHVHFDIDLKTGTRRYVRFMLSPELTKSVTDDREMDVTRPDNAFDLWFVNGTFEGKVYRGGAEVDSFGVDWPRYYGIDDVRDAVDIYVSRTRVRVLVNGETYVDESMADIGFDRAYVYLSQVSYNPCKEGECAANLQQFHWDNVAFDGPALRWNSLTPAGSRDVVFNAYSATACRVRGVEADPAGAPSWGRWITWVARLPDDGSGVGPQDVSCDHDYVKGNSNTPRDFEVVRQ